MSGTARTVVGAVLVAVGLTLAVPPLFMVRPWQAGITFGVLLVISGGVVLTDRRRA